jgi:hypothetical protein
MRFPEIADLADDWAATLAPLPPHHDAPPKDAPGCLQAQDRWGERAGPGPRSAARLAPLARIASESSARTTALRGPGDDPTAALAARLGALGHARAHTGSARALIFPPGEAPARAEAALRAAGYSGILRFRTGAA